jgi:uncharacterized membrane protein
MERKQGTIPALTTNWLSIFLVLYGVFVFLPFLAPVMMAWHLPALAKPIYFVYSFFCHQLPERSLFFFGPRWMYPIDAIQAAWQRTDNPLILRQFIGNPQMGWKVAWSDRMISMYGGVWLAALVWVLLGKRAPKVPIWAFVLLALPMALDGGTHFLSDFSGIAAGFRYTNVWLAVLTHHYFPQSFYVGDALGSFNSWMRWLSGLLFSFGLVGWAFPSIRDSLSQTIQLPLGRAKQINI